MPPIRTPTLKPVKTERTHEENQERAYIAASRRSDRSLEARIESARRASEIHKKRTGRALRVTEQDVVNEEMYEEEDDDLPAQYRRLQSHLQTGSYEFNRRLQAYMTSQMGMRNALMEQGNLTGPYPNAPFFTNQFGQPQQPTMMNPQMLHYPSFQGYRQNPYPMTPQGFPGMHNRSASISTPQDFANFMPQFPATPGAQQLSAEEQQRRMSLPAQAMQHPQLQQTQNATRPAVSRTASGTSIASGTAGSPTNATAPGSSQAQRPATSVPMPTAGGNFGANPTLDGSIQGLSFAPFSPSLPPETQQLLGQPSSMDNSSPFNPYWYTGNTQPLSYSYKPNSSANSSPPAKASPTMEQTLSLNPLDTAVGGGNQSPTSPSYITSANADDMTPFSNLGSHQQFAGAGDSFFTEGMKHHSLSRSSSSGQASGAVTPGGGADWTSFLESFDDNATT